MDSDSAELLAAVRPGKKPLYVRRATEVSDTRITLSIGNYIKWIAAGLFLVGLGCLAGCFFTSRIATWALLAAFITCGCVAAIAAMLIPPTVIFDKAVGKVWTGASLTSSLNWGSEQVQLADIKALQVVKDWVGRTPEVGHFNYELNLLLNDGTRYYLNSHKRHRLVYKDGKTIARFISIPLWDYSEK